MSVAIRLAESLRDAGFDIPRAAVILGLETANHAGRLEMWDGHPSFLFDGAHNPSGAQALRDYLDEFVRAPVTLVFGSMRDKHLDQMAAILFPIASRLVLTQPENPRAATVEALQRVALGLNNPQMDPQRISSTRSVVDAIRIARERTPGHGLICVTGSLYLIGEIQASLQMVSAEVAKQL